MSRTTTMTVRVSGALPELLPWNCAAAETELKAA